MKSGIYKITNPEGKIYIGKSVNCHKRFYDYRSLDCKNQPELYYSLKKYGWFHHTFEIIENYEVELLIVKENYWINHYDSINKGLNSDGKNRGSSGRTLSQSAKDEKSKKMKENWANGNFKRKWARQCINIQSGKIYNSIKEAKKDLNTTTFKIRKMLKEEVIVKYI